MKKTTLMALIMILSAVISSKAKANTHSKRDTAQVKLALHQVNLAYGKAYANGDSSLMLNCYTTDACIMPANSPALCGTAAALNFYKFGYKAGVRNVVFTTAGIFGLTGEYVTEQGSYEMFDSNNASMGKGKYLALWKKTAEGWKMYRDMFNSDALPVRSAKKSS